MTGDNLNLTLGQNGRNQPHSADDCGKTPTKTLVESDVGKILSDLNRAKVRFQLHTICAVLGVK